MIARRHWTPLLALIAICAGAAGCGGGGEDTPTDQAQIARVLTSFATSPVATICDDVVSDRFIRDVYGTIGQCREVNRGSGLDRRPRAVTVTQTRVEGDRATTAMAFDGGGADGLTGRVALVRADGTWKLDRFGRDFVESNIAVLATAASNAEERLQARCMAGAAQGLSTARLRSAVNALYGERVDDMPAAMRTCLLGETDVRAAFEQGVFEGFEQEGEKLTPARRACMKRELRASISDDQLADAFAKANLARFGVVLGAVLEIC